VFFYFKEYSIVKGICIILTLIAGKLGNRYLSTIMVFKKVESFGGVTRHPDCAKGFHYRCSSASKHLEHCRIVVDKLRKLDLPEQ
jgi:hypothetical protein